MLYFRFFSELGSLFGSFLPLTRQFFTSFPQGPKGPRGDRVSSYQTLYLWKEAMPYLQDWNFHEVYQVDIWWRQFDLSTWIGHTPLFTSGTAYSHRRGEAKDKR